MNDQVFWDRVMDMPPWEAEQELVLRREQIALENAMLMTERAKIDPRGGRRQEQEHKDLGVAISENGAALCRINERIKYLRKLQDQIRWRHAVENLFGYEAVEQCLVYMAQQWNCMDNRRSEWTGKA